MKGWNGRHNITLSNQIEKNLKKADFCRTRSNIYFIKCIKVSSYESEDLIFLTSILYGSVYIFDTDNLSRLQNLWQNSLFQGTVGVLKNLNKDQFNANVCVRNQRFVLCPIFKRVTPWAFFILLTELGTIR